ncbi:MAG: glycosyltransferase family 1 protein [Muribaculaceae bacterium]|nr:glycosyltransferase family 1 protein [Muribaculaceae bacterium]
MKILFVGDASNLHNCLAQALRDLGHTAIVASNGSHWMDTARDIDLSRGPGKMGAVKYILDVLRALPRMHDFDIVVTCGHIFLDLKPGKVRRVFDWLKRHNRSIVLSALGTDYYYYNACHDGKTYRYSDYMVGNKPSPYALSAEYQAKHEDNWKLPLMREHCEHILNNIDGAISCLWEYHECYKPLLGERLAYGGIPIDTRNVKPHIIEDEPQKVKFFIGVQRDRNILKGTDLLLEAARRTIDRYPKLCELTVVENVPYEEYVQKLSQSHVLLDQLYSYTPATNALLAMARGLVTVSGAEPEYYDFIGERDNRPIINVSPLVEGDIDAKLEWIVQNKHLLPDLSRRSREFVVEHNDSHVVARRHVEFYEKILKQ